MPVLTAFRFANWDTPFWASPSRRDGRFSRANGRVVQYWTLHPAGCWAELLRGLNVRSLDEARELRPLPWVAEIDVPDPPVTIDFENAEEHGVRAEALIDDDWGACQDWAADLDLPAVIVPSAALPGASNLVLFDARVRSRWSTEPIDPALDTPAEPVAAGAIAPADVLPLVRWRGSPHAGFEAWKTGAPPPAIPQIRVDRP